MHIHAFIEGAMGAAARALRLVRLPHSAMFRAFRVGTAGLALVAWVGAADAQDLEQSRAQLPGSVTKAPLNDRLRETVLGSVRDLLLDPASADVRIIVHFPQQRGDNGRVCGEVREMTAEGVRARTFATIYTRAGRVLTRLEDSPFEAYLASDTVFRNCSPRL